MRRLLLFRHSIKDGIRKDTIGPKGFALAVAQGETFVDEKFSPVAHGPLLRTKQTLLAMLAPQGRFTDPEDVLEITELGTGDLFSIMTAPQSFRSLAKERGNLLALIESHPELTVRDWAHDAVKGIETLLEFTGQDETTLAIGHSPIIEMAVWHAGFPGYPGVFHLAEMEGVELEMDVGGNIRFVRRIPAPQLPGINV